VVVFDTIRAWCPQAERTPEDANAVMHVARRELTKPGLAAVFVHHDRKGGGAFGEGVSGSYGLVGAVDVLVELRRVSDDPKDARRRMLVSRRFGDMDVTARLDGHRYVALPGAAGAAAGGPQRLPPDAGGLPATAVPGHLARTLTALGDAARPLTIKELLAAEGGSAAALNTRLAELGRRGLAERTGDGHRNDPYRWGLTSVRAGAVSSTAAPPAVRDDPEYVAYLKSPEWAAKRAEALRRADGHCGRCGPGGAPPVEVHHLTYERLRAELPGDLIALCAPCHRRAHPAA
jgi:hypothetical protein